MAQAQAVSHQFMVTGPQMEGLFIAPVGLTRIGRQADNDLALVHPLVSRRHARLECTAESCQVVDLDSTHGTTVNREQLAANTPFTLQPGDVVEIGAFRMVYEPIVVAESEAEPPPETAVSPEPELMPESPPPAAQPAGDEYIPASFAPTSPPPGLRPPSLRPPEPPPNGRFRLPPGLSFYDSRYLQYLPEIYHSGGANFVTRFLALLESILSPIEWNVDNFDLFLSPKTSPAAFLSWLANWYEIMFDKSWSEEKQRTLLVEAHQIYSRRGTAQALSRVLEIYMGVRPEIDDTNKNLEPFTFSVMLPLGESEVNRNVVERLIDMNKPAHTSYTLIFKE